MSDREPSAPSDSADRQGVTDPARRAIDRIRSGVVSGVVAARDPLVDRVGQAVGDVGRTWNELPGARVRRVRRMGRVPLSHLYGVHPEARSARPVEVGLQAIDVAEIAGTAVGGGAQRGGDFLPLKPSRTDNWASRWQRLRQAHDALAILPPIDVVKYGDKYWVVDGHNRVALALYGGQVAIDANVTELVPRGGHQTAPIGSLAQSAAASRAVRTAASGRKPSHELAHEDTVTIEPPDDGT